MKNQTIYSNITCWTLGVVIFVLGILNLILVHPVPGIIYILLSFLFFPPINTLLQKSFGFSIPFAVSIILAILIFWFTLGVSDLAEMYGL